MSELGICLMNQLEDMTERLLVIKQRLLAMSIDCSEEGEADEQTESD